MYMYVLFFSLPLTIPYSLFLLLPLPFSLSLFSLFLFYMYLFLSLSPFLYSILIEYLVLLYHVFTDLFFTYLEINPLGEYPFLIKVGVVQQGCVPSPL